MFIGSEVVFKRVVGQRAFILFSADYCPDCQVFKPVFEAKIKQHPNLSFYYLDTTHLPEIAQKEGVRSIPTLNFYSDGKLISTLSEYTQEGLDYFVSKCLA